VGLPDGEEIIILAFFVLTQYRRMTDGWTDRHVLIVCYDGPDDGSGIVYLQPATCSDGPLLLTRRVVQCLFITRATLC